MSTHEAENCHAPAFCPACEGATHSWQQDHVEETSPKVYRVPSWNVEGLKKRMAILAKRAVKLGCEEPKLVERGFEDVAEMRVDPISQLAEKTGRVDRFFLYEVTGKAPSYSGWTFVAAIDSMPDVGNLVRVAPGEVLPEKYRTEEPHCDHCKAKRNRINHYVVHNKETGECKMVGSGCIRDFLGHNAPENILSMASLWSSLDGVMEESEDRGGGGSREPLFLDLVKYLAYVAAAIQKHGWVSSSNSDKTSTARSLRCSGRPRRTNRFARWIARRTTIPSLVMRSRGRRVSRSSLTSTTTSRSWLRRRSFPIKEQEWPRRSCSATSAASSKRSCARRR